MAEKEICRIIQVLSDTDLSDDIPQTANKATLLTGLRRTLTSRIIVEGSPLVTISLKHGFFNVLGKIICIFTRHCCKSLYDFNLASLQTKVLFV